ncbi:MAG: thioether cross-link-forming SCIFF peptide maturase [Syntrophomonadaceae bacterium]|nr:thioether cross-link-forming SCIFF peptide maturase [Syntrophomonadaceae bacterium]
MVDLQGYDFSSHLHLFHIKGYDMLLDVNSGSIHVLDEQARSFIQELIKADGNWSVAHKEFAAHYDREMGNEVQRELEQAYHEGSMFSLPEDLLSFNYGHAVPKSICLNIAHICNMRCRYCFAEQGSFGQAREIMSQDVARRAVDFLITASGERNNLELDFFGGEPLLNFDVVKETVAYGRERAAVAGKRFNFTLTTNALNLDEEKRNYLIDEGIAIIMSLDGRPEVNDRMRIHPEGAGTYHDIVSRIREMVAMQPVSYFVRGTFTAENLDFSRDFLHLCELGFENISLEPVTGGEPGIALEEEHLFQIMAEYEELAEIIWAREQDNKPVNFFHFNLELNRGPCLPKRITGCGAGIEYLAVTPGGDIYPCHQFIGQSEFKMGNVAEQGLDQSIKDRFAWNTVPHKGCLQCWARFYCGGGCHAAAFFANGDLSKPYQMACAMHKKRLEAAFYLAAKRIGG